MRLRLNLYRGNGAEKLSTEDAKQGKESYASSVARVAGSPVTLSFYSSLYYRLYYIPLVLD
jgi:hypothetical protein